MTRPISPRFVSVRSAGSLLVVFDTVRRACVEHGRRFQADAARAHATALNAASVEASL